MSKYIAEALSRQDIRELANEFRKELGLYNELKFPIVESLDVLCELFPDFSYEIVKDNELPEDIHAETNVLQGHIKIKETVYSLACRGEGRDRMTIAHEIGHYILVCHSGFKLTRNHKNRSIRAYEDPEWQAKCFGGELMIPKHLINGLEFYTLMEKCGVSLPAARYQCGKYREEDTEFNVI